MLTRFFQPLLDLLVRSMAEEIHKEVVFPLPFLARPRFYIRQVDIVLLKDIEHISQSAGFVGSAEQDGGFTGNDFKVFGLGRFANRKEEETV